MTWPATKQFSSGGSALVVKFDHRGNCSWFREVATSPQVMPFWLKVPPPTNRRTCPPPPPGSVVKRSVFDAASAAVQRLSKQRRASCKSPTHRRTKRGWTAASAIRRGRNGTFPRGSACDDWSDVFRRRGLTRRCGKELRRSSTSGRRQRLSQLCAQVQRNGGPGSAPILILEGAEDMTRCPKMAKDSQPNFPIV